MELILTGVLYALAFVSRPDRGGSPGPGRGQLRPHPGHGPPPRRDAVGGPPVCRGSDAPFRAGGSRAKGGQAVIDFFFGLPVPVQALLKGIAVIGVIFPIAAACSM